MSIFDRFSGAGNIDGLRADIADLSHTKSQLADEIQASTGARDALQQELASLQEQRATLTTNLVAVRGEIAEANTALAVLHQSIDTLQKKLAAQTEQETKLTNELRDLESKCYELNEDITKLQSEQTRLRDETVKLQAEYDSLDDAPISYGLYKKHFTFESSSEFDAELEKVRGEQDSMIRVGTAATCSTNWTVDGSATKGERMTKQNEKLMLRAFNGECDAAIARVRWNNIGAMENRINSAHSAINRLGTANQITIADEYLQLRLKELRLEFEKQEVLYREKEEQRRIQAQMREEEKTQREIEKAKADAEADERRYQAALTEAQAQVSGATGKHLDTLNKRIDELERSLKAAQEMKARAVARAQITRSGHIYVVSNIGSFGENVYKIGMTRRLDPMDRIYELSDASVPFDFDVHAIVFTEDAPTLERKFHDRFSDRRVNLLNERREFFSVTLQEIESVANEFGASVSFVEVPEAKDYRATVSMRAAKQKAVNP